MTASDAEALTFKDVFKETCGEIGVQRVMPFDVEVHPVDVQDDGDKEPHVEYELDAHLFPNDKADPTYDHLKSLGAFGSSLAVWGSVHPELIKSVDLERGRALVTAAALPLLGEAVQLQRVA